MRKKFSNFILLTLVCVLFTGVAWAEPSAADPFDPNASPYDDIVIPEKVYAAHDLIMVEVEERTNGSNSTTMRTQKETTYDSILDAFVGFDKGNLTTQELEATLADLKSSKEQSSRGQQSVTRQITGIRFTARVVEVLPNGHLVLEAHKHRRLDFEDESLILFGVVDPDHVDKEKDSVKSERLADLDLQIVPSGAIADAQKRGFFSWLWDKLWPF